MAGEVASEHTTPLVEAARLAEEVVEVGDLLAAGEEEHYQLEASSPDLFGVPGVVVGSVVVPGLAVITVVAVRPAAKIAAARVGE